MLHRIGRVHPLASSREAEVQAVGFNHTNVVVAVRRDVVVLLAWGTIGHRDASSAGTPTTSRRNATDAATHQSQCLAMVAATMAVAGAGVNRNLPLGW